MKQNLRTLYNFMPKLFQNYISSAFFGLNLQFIFNGGFEYLKLKKLLSESQNWSLEKLQNYQLIRLKKLIKYSYENVPYYTEIFKNLNLKPKDITSFQDLEKLPILTRKDVIANFDRLISKKVKKKNLLMRKTSGSTGQSMNFYLSNYALGSACYSRFIDIIGHKISDKKAAIRFPYFLKKKDFKNNYYYDRFFRSLYLSLESKPQELDKYFKLLKKFKPTFMKGNPSMLYMLALHAEKNGIQPIKFKSFLSLAEQLFPFQREKITKIFGCEVFDSYSSKECTVSAIECQQHKGLHIDMESCLIEILDQENKPLSFDKIGKVISTRLHDFAMPLIRYDTGDLASLSEKKCPCGKESLLLNSIEGRQCKVLRFGNKILYPTAFSDLIIHCPNIEEFQFVQKSQKILKIKIVKRKEYNKEDTKRLLQLIKNIIQDDSIELEIDFVNSIPRTKQGKFEIMIK